MPMDWGGIIKAGASIIPSVIGATAGTKAVQGAANTNRAAAEQGYNRAVGAVTGASNQANDIYNWGMNQQIPIAGWQYQQGRGDMLNALNGGQQALAGGQENIASMLSPYTSAGIRGSAGTNFLLHGSGTGGGQSMPTSSMQPAGRSGFPSGSGNFPSVPIPTFGTPTAGGPGSPGFNALTSGGGAGISSFNPTGHVDRGAGGMISDIAGGAGGIAGMAIGGPIGAAVGLGSQLVGTLINKLTQRGREKKAASSEANDFSDWVWKEAVPQAKSQGLGPDQLHQIVQAGWDQYKNWLSGNLHNQDVINNSEQSQLGYTNQGAGQFGGAIA